MYKFKIAIIGENSYIGRSFYAYNEQNQKYDIQYINSRNHRWEAIDFSSFDVVLHAAGIAHIKNKPSLKPLYYEINRDLPYAIAKKSKKEGVKQFIFLSSIIVYGDDTTVGKRNIISKDTVPKPGSFYGDSKLQAEALIETLHDTDFNVTILRLPMVYGEGCKGNFPRLVKIARMITLFPDLPNERSMIYIGNLCRFLEKVIDCSLAGLFIPQNQEYVSTKDIISWSAVHYQMKIKFISVFNPMVIMLSWIFPIIRKVFASKTVDREMSGKLDDYNIYSFGESMERYFVNDQRGRT